MLLNDFQRCSAIIKWFWFAHDLRILKSPSPRAGPTSWDPQILGPRPGSATDFEAKDKHGFKWFDMMLKYFWRCVHDSEWFFKRRVQELGATDFGAVATLARLKKKQRTIQLKLLREQYNTIQYNTIQYNTVQYNTIQCDTKQYDSIP